MKSLCSGTQFLGDFELTTSTIEISNLPHNIPERLIRQLLLSSLGEKCKKIKTILKSDQFGALVKPHGETKCLLSFQDKMTMLSALTRIHQFYYKGKHVQARVLQEQEIEALVAETSLSFKSMHISHSHQEVEEVPLNMVKTYFGNPMILINLFLMSLIWLTSGINSYLITQITEHKSPTAVGYETFCELFAILVAGLMFHFIGLRSSMAATFVLSFLTCCVLITHPGNSETLKTLIMPALSLMVSSTVTISYLAHSKLFPVGCAATSLGLSGIFTRAFEGAVPFLDQVKMPIPIVVFAVVTLGGLLATSGLQPTATIAKQSDHSSDMSL